MQAKLEEGLEFGGVGIPFPIGFPPSFKVSFSGHGKVCAVVLLVYGDESLDATQSRVCAVAGVIGTEEMWENLEAKWTARNGGIPFHATDCESDRGDYAPKDRKDSDKKHKENKDLYRELTILVAESGLGGFASSQDLAAQRKAFPSPYEPPLYYQGFMDVLEAMRNAADNRGQMAELTFDSRIGTEFNATEIYAYLQESGLYWRERLARKLSFVSSREEPRIQIADLFAHEAMKELDNEVGPTKRVTRKSWECLKRTGNFRIEKLGEEYFSDPRMQPQTLLKALGFKDGDFNEWRERKRLPYGYTSFLRFLFEQRSKMTDEQLKHFDTVYGFSWV